MGYGSNMHLGVESTGPGEGPGMCFDRKFSSDGNLGFHSHCVRTLVRQKLSVCGTKGRTYRT